MSAIPRINPVEILLIEDNPVDVIMIREAFNEARIANRVTVITDGQQAVDYLRTLEREGDVALPDLIVLDLNLPRRDGREILEGIKSNSALKAIPVIVLSSSEDAEDVKHAYANMANCYIPKPIDFDEFMTVVKRIGDFWLSSVELPDT